MLSHDVVFESQLLWMVLGEKMSAGFSIYSDIDTLTSVFSGGIYWLLDLGFGRSNWAHSVLAMFFIMVQIGFFNFFSPSKTK